MTDLEMDAIRGVAAALEPLDRTARARVLTWAEDRFLDQLRREVEDLSWASTKAQVDAYKQYAQILRVDQRTPAHALAHVRSHEKLVPTGIDPERELEDES
jgi:hypothetical protein